MDVNEATVILAKAQKTFSKLLEKGSVLFEREDYLASIQAFTEAIELGLKLKEAHVKFANKINLPSEMSETIKETYIGGLKLAYLGRATSYYAIKEEEKGAADIAMADKLGVEMKNYNSPNSNHISEKKEPAPKPSYSKSSTNDLDDEIKKVDEVLKTCTDHLNLGNNYLQKSNYAMAIREFTKAIKLVSPAKDSAVSLRFPSEIIKVYIANLRTAYLARAMSYYAIDEEEKGAVDTAMAKKLEAEMKNYDSPKSNHIPEKKEPAPKPTYSSSNTNSGNEFSFGKALFWTAIILLVIAALVSYFTGISFGKSVLLTFVGTIALIIWAGNR